MKELIIETRKQFGLKIKAERENQKMTRAEAARRSGLSRWQILQIEKGAWSYQIDSLLSLCGVLNIRIIYENI